ncbi:ribosome-recycling factor, mitochondrial isoform X2 [Gadus macrocephalus]|uniref:ribosome-recycling factor, mitochondrial isoform X2 n=1 Tax=Gadus macrocephalus TaxID=80720 RepID=UPI0028CB2B14|nr:ribosome-recycling factor, mitochondrial isoform X2 [Gadus macrocephalus]
MLNNYWFIIVSSFTGNESRDSEELQHHQSDLVVALAPVAALQGSSGSNILGVLLILLSLTPKCLRSSLSAPTLSASDLTSCCSQVTAGRPLSADLFHSRPRPLGLYSGALDHIVVTTPDGKFPLNQLGQVSMKSPQLIVVNMTSSPEATVAVTRALRESSMKLNPEVDGAIIKVPLPKVTREHRENLGKLAKQLSNKAKDSLRRVRSNAVTQVKKAKEETSEDTIRLLEKQLQQMADNMAIDIDKQLASKTKELLG